MPLLSRPARPRRACEWNEGRAVTFIVTLAASRSVTLASQAAGLSRKAAYALKARDPAFADAWNRALAASSRPGRRTAEGDKTDKSDTPPIRPAKGDNPRDRAADESARDAFFADLAALRRTH